SAAFVAKRMVPFPVGHSADVGQVAAATGAYVNEDPQYLESTGFVLAPDGTVLIAVYSSDGIGRLVADDVAGCGRCLPQHAAVRVKVTMAAVASSRHRGQRGSPARAGREVTWPARS